MALRFTTTGAKIGVVRSVAQITKKKHLIPLPVVEVHDKKNERPALYKALQRCKGVLRQNGETNTLKKEARPSTS